MLTKKTAKIFTLFTFLLLAFSLTINAQSDRKSKYSRAKTNKVSTSKLKNDVDSKRISDKDRAAIVALFRGVSPKKYKLQFHNGDKKRPSKYGRKSVRMQDLKQVQKITNPRDAMGWIVFVVEGDDVIYVLAVGGKDRLQSVLGAAKAKRLNGIMAKYN